MKIHPTSRTLAVLALSLLMAAPMSAAKKKKKRSAPQAAAAPSAWEEGLLDWSKLPFSDQDSHGVLLRREDGLSAWTLRSSFAFGSAAAAPHPAKDLLDFRLRWVVEGEAEPRFAKTTVPLRSYPRWTEEEADEGGLHAEMVTLFSDTDVVMAIGSVTNTGTKPLRVRPLLQLSRPFAAGYKAALRASTKHPALWLDLDRGAMVQRPLAAHVGVWMSAQNWRADLDPSLSAGLRGTAQPLSRGAEAFQEGGLGVGITWALPHLLVPNQTVRLPIMLVWGADKDAVEALAAKQWSTKALPLGRAWREAKERWKLTRSRLPDGVDPAWQNVAKRAALVLLANGYAKRGNLNSDMVSGDKGTRDAFFSVEAPLAALGWAELDQDRAENSLLELAGFSAAAPAPVPPFTGEEKLAWEAGGLPLHGLASWELYHRDPQADRGSRFLGDLAAPLRQESAWWGPARDGDGNGLYAFGKEEEKPLSFQATALDVGAQALSGTAPTLQTYSVALTALMGWQKQAAAALAGAAANNQEAEQWLADVAKTREALRAQAFDTTTANFGDAKEGFWPWHLGLMTETAQVDLAAHGWQKALEAEPWAPWERYYLIRTIALWGYFKEAKAHSDKLLQYFDKNTIFCSICGQNGQNFGKLDSASAAVVLALSLEREQQEVFLTSKTASFEARWLQFRSPDGLFYMKRTKIPDKKSIYSKIYVQTTENKPILSEKSFTFYSDESTAFQIQSEWPLNIARASSPKNLIFKGSHKIALLTPAKVKFVVTLFPPETASKH